LSGLVQGEKYREIASRLCISIDTVRTHTMTIYRKCKVHSRGELVWKIMSTGSARVGL